MEMMLTHYCDMLEAKYMKMITNKWFWVVVLLVVLVGFFAYAFYCTSLGYSFNGNIKLNWPKVWEMGIGCKK